MPDEPKAGKDRVTLVLLSGTEIDPAEVAPPEPEQGGITGEARKWSSKLPPDCPVIALGVNKQIYYYLDTLRQINRLTASNHKRLDIGGMFAGHHSFLYEHWPRIGKDGVRDHWRPEKVAEALMTACSEKPIWQPFERERGVGAWRGDDGELILHCGDSVWVGPSPASAVSIEEIERQGWWESPGMIGDCVYPADPAQPRFAATPVPAGDHGPANELLKLLMCWPFRRGELDAILLLGWIGAAMIGGALPWRPQIWLTGSLGTGKSVLKDVIKTVFGGQLVYTSDTSGAGLWQKLGHSTAPVLVEELEAEVDNRRAQSVVRFARQASSGGYILRGGANHVGSEFMVRSCFLFSSINIPPMEAADMSRQAILELDEITAEAAPVINRERLEFIGLQCRRRLIDQWPRFEDTFGRFRSTFRARKHTSRGADQYGILITLYDMLTSEGVPDRETATAWAARLDPGGLIEIADAGRDEIQCRDHLLTSKIDAFGERKLVLIGEWIARAAGWSGEAMGVGRAEANKVLQGYGLRVIEAEGAPYLLIANYHKGLGELYAGTHWAGRSGGLGGWARSWRRLAKDSGGGAATRTWWFGANLRCSQVPLRAVLPDGPQRAAALVALDEPSPDL